MSSTESQREIGEEKQLLSDILHAEEGLESQLRSTIRCKGGVDNEAASALGYNRGPEISDEDYETRVHGDKLALFLHRHGNAPSRPYARFATSWSTRHG